MKVKELINLLNTLDPDIEIYTPNDPENYVPSGIETQYLVGYKTIYREIEEIMGIEDFNKLQKSYHCDEVKILDQKPKAIRLTIELLNDYYRRVSR